MILQRIITILFFMYHLLNELPSLFVCILFCEMCVVWKDSVLSLPVCMLKISLLNVHGSCVCVLFSIRFIWIMPLHRGSKIIQTAFICAEKKMVVVDKNRTALANKFHITY